MVGHHIILGQSNRSLNYPYQQKPNDPRPDEAGRAPSKRRGRNDQNDEAPEVVEVCACWTLDAEVAVADAMDRRNVEAVGASNPREEGVGMPKIVEASILAS